MGSTRLTVALVALSLGTAVTLLGCSEGVEGGSSDAGSSGSRAPIAAWEGASQNESLLYQQARSLGLDRDPDVQKLMVTTLLHEQVYAPLDSEPFSEDDLKAFFEERQDSFATPARIEVHRILLEPNADLRGAELEAHARKIHQTLSADPSQFARLARQHSIGERAQAGGDLGFISRQGQGGLPAEVVERSFAMQPGGKLELLATGEGWNILRVTAARARIEPSFEEARYRILRQLRVERHRALYDRYLDGLRGGDPGSE